MSGYMNRERAMSSNVQTIMDANAEAIKAGEISEANGQKAVGLALFGLALVEFAAFVDTLLDLTEIQLKAVEKAADNG